MYRLVLFLTVVLCTAELNAQDGGSEPAERAEEITAERLQKAQTLTNAQTQTQPKAGFLKQAGHVLGRLPLSFEVDGLGPGAGGRINYDQWWRNEDDDVRGNLWGSALLHGFYSFGSSVMFRHVTPADLTFSVAALRSDSPQLEYYGEGMNSSIHNRTDYRLENTQLAILGSYERRHFGETCQVAQRFVNVGPGTNDNLPSTESVFSPAEAPGIDVQPNFLIAGCSSRFDWRNVPGVPTQGTYVEGGYERYQAQGDNQFSFNRVSGLVEHYIPFLNHKRVIQLRARTDLSFHSDSQVVPFYLQPTLGSDTDLRGYRRYRFYDENLFSVNAEYRWEISTGFDMALFVDGGKVFARPGEIGFKNMDGSAGFGIRFNNTLQTIARLDVGFSREGVQVWFRLEKLFF